MGTLYDLGTSTHLHFAVQFGTVDSPSWRGALPTTNCGGDPAFPWSFVDPVNYVQNHLAPPPNPPPARVVALTASGVVYEKEPYLNSVWNAVGNSAQAIQATGSRIGMLQNGSLYVKDGTWDSTWVQEATNVRRFLIAGSRIAFIDTSNNLYAKEGDLYAGWYLESAPADDLALSSTMLGVISGGNLSVKIGLTDSWTAEANNVLEASLGDYNYRISLVQSPNYALYVKEGGLSAGWTLLDTQVGHARLGSTRVCGATVSNAMECKDGALNGPFYVLQTSGVSNVRVNGTRFAYVATDGGLWAYEGGIANSPSFTLLTSGTDLELN